MNIHFFFFLKKMAPLEQVQGKSFQSFQKNRPSARWRTYFTARLDVPGTGLLGRNQPPLESMVTQAWLTQGRLEVWVRGREVQPRRARVLQTGALVFVHTDHGALDPSAYLRSTEGKRRESHSRPLSFTARGWGRWGGRDLEEKGSILQLLNLQPAHVLNWPMLDSGFPAVRRLESFI